MYHIHWGNSTAGVPNFSTRYTFPFTTLNSILAYEIKDLYPDYDGFTNNCQNFVQYLMKYVCPQPTVSIPSTVQDVLQNLFSLNFVPPIMSTRITIEVVARRNQADVYQSALIRKGG